MPKITLLFALLAAFNALAQDDSARRNVTFSKHSAAVQLASYDKETSTHQFRGRLKLTGTLFLVFDMTAADRANGEINFKKLVPDPASAALLPAVVQGFYPGPVAYVNVDVSQDQVERLFGGPQAFARLSHGSSREVSTRVEVVVDRYAATVECDSRSYSAHVVSVAPVRETTRQAAATQTAPPGC
jgi:hypothetical protein